jgi:transmembrane sensor
MNNRENMSDEIKELIVSYLTKTINFQDSVRLKKWIEESDINKELLNDLTTSWLLSAKSDHPTKFEVTRIWEKLDLTIQDEEFEENWLKTDYRPLFRFLRVAAVWILIFSLGAFTSWWFGIKNQQIQPSPTEITAPLAAKSMIKMPDGSIVWLNAGSKITYYEDFNKNDRKVMLTGEAFFSVATNKSKPFTVYTSDIIVRAFGTRFNVKAYPEEKTVTTTLEEGKVDVKYTGKLMQEESIVLKPNEKFVFFKPGLAVERKNAKPISKSKLQPELAKSAVVVEKNINIALYTSWKDERWIIQSIPLETLAPMLERRLNMKISFTNDKLKKYKFSGIIENETAEQIMAALKMTAPLDFKISKDTIVLTNNRKLEEKYSHIISSKK